MFSKYVLVSLVALGLASCTPSNTSTGAGAQIEPQKNVPVVDATAATTAAPAASSAAPPVEPAPAKACGMPKSLPKPDWPKKLEPTQAADPAPFVAGSATIALFPDTQYYIDCRTSHFRKQVDWVMAERTNRNIRAVVTLGDLTEHNTKEEWDFYRESLSSLDPTFPFLLNVGNHDYGDGGRANNRASFFGEYFNDNFVAKTKSLLEAMEPGKLENAFYSIDLGKVSVGVLILEWSPRKKTVEWADKVLAKYPKHRVMMATHAYLYSDSTRYDYKKRGETQEWNPLSYGTNKGEFEAAGNHDGEMLWSKLLKKHPHVFLTANGHVLNNGTGLLASKGDKGNTVHQVLVNYQMLDEGGLGYMRLMEFLPDGKTVRFKTYSPTLGVYATGKEHDFSVTVDPPLWK